MKNSSRRAVTLMEMLIVLALFGLALTAISLFLNTGTRLLRRSESRIDAQRAVLRLTGKLIGEIQSSLTSSVTLAEQGSGNLTLAFAHPRRADGTQELDPGTGASLYPHYLVYFRSPTQGCLRRHYWPLSPSQLTPPALDPTALLAGLTGNPGEVVLPALERFLTTSTSPLKVRLELKSASGEPVELEALLQTAR